MSQLGGIHDLAYVFSRVGASADAGARQDWVGMGFNIAGGIGKFIWYRKGHGILKKTLEQVGKEALPTPTAIVDVTMVAVVIIDLLNGFGSPDEGDKFASGVDKLKVVDAQLKLATPYDGAWEGDAADDYAEELAALRAIVAQMQELDAQMRDLVKSQGDKIFYAHRTMAILGCALVAAQGIALLLYLIPVTGPMLSFKFQVYAAMAAIMTVTATEAGVLSNSLDVASKTEPIQEDYVSLGKSAEVDGTFTSIDVAGAKHMDVGSFAAISNSLSDYAGPPTVASLAQAAGADGNVFEERRELVSATTSDAAAGDSPSAPETGAGGTGAGGTGADGTGADGTGEDEIGEDETETTPRFTLPTMAQVSQATGQAAKISNDLAQPLNAVNETLGSVQQVYSMAQQGEGVVDPVEEAVTAVANDGPQIDESVNDEAMLSHDAQDLGEARELGAAAGADAGERAPIVGPEGAGEPTEEQGPQARSL